ncbi:MAG: SEC-C metal-binding domain-containing protein [Alphaproteobacteria bacterium]|nr:SEC-C metal-binding domain-containing protein [Alphaproteobacteria bacterium]
MPSVEAGLPARYTPPVSQLLAIGDDKVADHHSWRDYAGEYGFSSADIPELIQLATDWDAGTGENDPAVWAQMHAWRALGQMRADAAVMPLLTVLEDADEDDYAADRDVPVALGMIGAAAFASVERLLVHPDTSLGTRLNLIGALATMVEFHPDLRAACLHRFERILAGYPVRDETVNGFVLIACGDIRAVELIVPIRAAFADDAVDISVAGDLEDIEIKLGLRTARATPAPNYHEAMFGGRGLIEGDLPGEPIVKAVKIGRNDPCPCGSGKKYKKCCLV